MPENLRPRVDSRNSELDHLAASRAWNKARCNPLCPGLRTPSLHSNCCLLPSKAIRIPIKCPCKDSRWELGSSSTESSLADEEGGTLLNRVPLEARPIPNKVQLNLDSCWELGPSSTESSPASEKGGILLNRTLGDGSPSSIQGAGKRARPESSKHFGVRYRPDLSKWVAEIRVAQWKSVDKKVWLGTFETEEGAARAVDSARKILKCKKKRAWNFPCEKLNAYSVEIPPNVAIDDLHDDAMYKIVTSFVKKKSQEYAASFTPDPTGFQPLSLNDIPTDTPRANDCQSLLHEQPTLDDMSQAAKQMASPEFQIVDDAYMEAGMEAEELKLSDFGEFNEDFPDFDIDDLFEDPSCFKPFQGTQRQCFAAMKETPHSKKAKHRNPSNIEREAMGYCAREERELADQASKVQQRPHAPTGSLWAGGEYQQSGYRTLVDTDLDDLEDIQEFWQTTENIVMYCCSSHDQGPEGSDQMAPSSGYESYMMAMDLGPSFDG